MPHGERRVNQRIPAEFEVNYIHDGDYLISLTKDISVDGMFIYTENPPAVGEQSKLIFSLSGLAVSVNAKVVWTHTSGPANDNGMGVQFLDPTDELRTEILRLVNRIAVLPS